MHGGEEEYDIIDLNKNDEVIYAEMIKFWNSIRQEMY